MNPTLRFLAFALVLIMAMSMATGLPISTSRCPQKNPPANPSKLILLDRPVVGGIFWPWGVTSTPWRFAMKQKGVRGRVVKQMAEDGRGRY
ncbi:hypothetical protein BKA70DRAFT_1307656 [Coprinopsis sp. MPI-PUGE-AT-0042]|nr:hypothetical protein BKA70DRAFT_1307656 [Coprinopsis sp. MPI-PUGE-AT-0042]